LLRWARDYAESKADGHISHSVVLESFGMLEIDDVGLEAQDRRYLEALITIFSGGPAGLKSIAHSIDIPPDTLEDEVEPFLLRCGFIQRTPRGRMVTAATFKHLQLPRPRR
jgi:Holliday junction DNA helicase RuvB